MKGYIIFLISLVAFANFALAQDQNLTDAGTEVKAEQGLVIPQPEDQDGEEVYNQWSDPLYYQFEKMMPHLARSLGRLDSRITTLAVTELSFSQALDRSFRKVATAKLYGQLLLENPRLRLIKCNECNMVRSEIKNGVLTISKGLANKEARANLADKMGVQGFLTAMVIEEERQLSVVINVYDAKEGRIILSDVIPGIPVPENTYWNFYLGQATIPVTLSTGDGLDHYGTLLGAEKSMRFAESWMLSASFGLLSDNNSKLEDGHVTFSTAMLFDGTVGWEVLSAMNNNASFVVAAGMGQFLSTQFNFSVYQKVGLKTTIGQVLTFNIYSLSFTETNLATPVNGLADKLTGSATTVAFGFQF